MNEYGITTPSIIKAAWSIVLGHLTGQKGVVFGEVVAGRNAPVQGIDRIVGPCFDIIPIRIGLDPKTCPDLLKRIEEPHISGIPHENLGILKIIDRCTTWPKWSRLGSAVSIDATPHKLSLGESSAKISVVEKIADIVLDTAAGKDGIYINFAYEPDVLSSSNAKKVLAYFCETVDFLVKFPDALLSSWRILDPDVTVASTTAPQPCKSDISAVGLDSSGIGVCEDLVARIWERLNLPRSHTTDTQCPFYEARNHVETALVLRDSYHQIGGDLTLEDIMDYPTFDEHVRLVGKVRMSTSSVGNLSMKMDSRYPEPAKDLIDMTEAAASNVDVSIREVAP